MPRKAQGWITFQTSHEERQLLEQVCRDSQRTKTEVLRELVRSLHPETSGGQSPNPQPVSPIPEEAEPGIVPQQPIAKVGATPTASAPASPRKPLKVSSRNVLKGRVKRLVTGAVNSEITLEITQPVELIAIITRTSVEDLGLAEGQEAFAVIKSSDVVIAKE